MKRKQKRKWDTTCQGIAAIDMTYTLAIGIFFLVAAFTSKGVGCGIVGLAGVFMVVEALRIPSEMNRRRKRANLRLSTRSMDNDKA